MSSETDHPRQRTVAELLAEHGDAGATGRRRRRRAPDEPDDDAGPPGHSAFVAPAPQAERRAPVLPDRSVLREPVPPALSRPVPEESRARRAESPSAPVFPSRPVAEPERENPTDVMPRFHDAAPAVDDGLTGPMPHQTGAYPAPADDDAAGPSTMVGAAPVGAEAWHRARTEDARTEDARTEDARTEDARTEDAQCGGTAIDGGPPLQRGPVDADEGPAGLGRGRPVAPVDLAKHDPDDDAQAAPKPRERRLGRAAAAQETAGPAWAAVMVQWIAGALGGAVLWVGFRFLWRNLPVVALASAVLVTVGLVVIVRALLHNNDRRTTIFAVLVGLLLTVSPAILVLLGR